MSPRAAQDVVWGVTYLPALPLDTLDREPYVAEAHEIAQETPTPASG